MLGSVEGAQAGHTSVTPLTSIRSSSATLVTTLAPAAVNDQSVQVRWMAASLCCGICEQCYALGVCDVAGQDMHAGDWVDSLDLGRYVL